MNRQVPKEEIKVANKCMKKVTLTSNGRQTNKIIIIADFSPKKSIEKIWGNSHSPKLLKM